MLADAIPLEESRAVARQLLKPYLEGLENKNPTAVVLVLRSLATADPAGALRKLEELKLGRLQSVILSRAVPTLARTDPLQAEALAEVIEVPAQRAMALVAVADALPGHERGRKLALLDRAAVQAKVATPLQFRMFMMGEVAERWYEVGQTENAKTLFAEGLDLADQVPKRTEQQRQQRGKFAARLARVDLPSALAIAKDFPPSGADSANRMLRNIAFHLAAENPAEAERVLRQVSEETGRSWLPAGMAWKMAPIDPARAERLVQESQRYFDHPQTYLFLALGLKSRDKAAAHQAFQTAMQGIDRVMKEEAEDSPKLGPRQALLPLVEQIDPVLVPEFFWRVVATRRSIGNPRSASELESAHLVLLLAWYDREVAAAIFESVRAQMQHTDDLALAGWSTEFLAWSMFDPRAAVSRLAQVPVSLELDLSADRARQRVSDMLGLSHEARWRIIWNDFADMDDLSFRDTL